MSNDIICSVFQFTSWSRRKPYCEDKFNRSWSLDMRHNGESMFILVILIFTDGRLHLGSNVDLIFEINAILEITGKGMENMFYLTCQHEFISNSCWEHTLKRSLRLN